jgi:predicted ATP-dependent endonuclease of OLD family
MKITKVTITDFQRLRYVKIEPSGSLVVIRGRNAQGKTSVLDAIMAALAGKKFAPKMPVRRGAEKTETVIETEEFRIRRYFTAEGNDGLEVKRLDGALYSAGQTLLDRFQNRFLFDPLAFVRLEPKDQADTLRKIVGVDTSTLDREHAATYEERTSVNRGLKEVTARVEAFPPALNVPDEEVSVAELASKLGEANGKNNDLTHSRREVADARQTLEARRGNVKQMEARLEAMRAEVAKFEEVIAKEKADLEGKAKKLEAEAAKLQGVALVDTSAIEEAMRTAEETNRKVRSNKTRSELVKQRDELKAKSEHLTKKLEAIATKKTELLSSAKFPVEGLSFDEEGVTYGGIPLAQASQAEKVRISAAVGLAHQSELKVLLIRDGSLLDDDSLEALKEVADEHDALILLEKVGASPEGEAGAIVIEDGMIVGQEQPVREPAAAGTE